MPVGTIEQPLGSGEPVVVARRLASSLQIGAWPGLHYHKGQFYLWYGDRWLSRDHEHMEDWCWTELADAHIQAGDGVARFKPNRNKIADIVRALQAITRVNKERVPCFLGSPPDGWDPGNVIAFNDYVVETEIMEAMERTPNWFSHSILPCNYEMDATCPLWEQCLKEWGQGDPLWADLLQRWFGYCLMSQRREARWLLMYGKVRGGKGTISKVLKQLVGNDAWTSTSLGKLGTNFGQDGLQNSKVICIHEVSELDRRDGEACVQFMKTVIGEDPIDIEPKYGKIIRNVILPANIMVQSNEIPKLGNRGAGLSSKMLVLPFEESWVGKEDTKLIDRLLDELPGIAAWAVRGAHAMQMRHDGVPFQMPERSTEAIKRYHLVNNPFDAFLESRFNKNAEGFVSYSIMWEVWGEWKSDNGIEINISRPKFCHQLEEGCTWPLRRGRMGGNGPRGFRGLSRAEIKRDDDAI